MAIRCDGIELHLQWHAKGELDHPGDRPTYRFVVGDTDGLYAEFCQSGAIDPHAPKKSPWASPGDTPWHTREFHVQDPDRNGLQFYRPL